MADIRLSSARAFADAQLRFWAEHKGGKILSKKKPLPFITISREYGCGGYELALLITEILNKEYNPQPIWVPYDRGVLEIIMKDMGLTAKLADTLSGSGKRNFADFFQTLFSSTPPQVAVYRKMSEVIRTLAIHGNVILVGRAGQGITRDLKNGFHIRLVGPLDWRIEKIKKFHKVSEKEARKEISDNMTSREQFLHEFFKMDINDSHNYDLVVNNARFETEAVAKVIICAMKARELL